MENAYDDRTYRDRVLALKKRILELRDDYGDNRDGLEFSD